MLPKFKKTPNQLFEESSKPNCFTVDLYNRIKLLTPKTTIKVLRNQITLKRDFDVYEYQLPAAFASKLNNTTVAIRYEALNEEIYVYDATTDEFITELKPKPLIHAAKANQTPKDVEPLNKNKGRIAGIKSKAKRENEDLLRAALEENPEAHTMIDKMTTPKDIIQ